MVTLTDSLKKKLNRTDWMFILANLVPVYGVWFQGWDAREAFLVYCFETIIIGIFTLLKLGITGYFKGSDDWQSNEKKLKMPALGFMIFFIVHYGMFVAIQLTIFFSVSGIGTGSGFFSFMNDLPELISPEVMLMLGVFVISYGFRNLNDYILTGEYKTAPMSFLMFQPYARILVQQLTVILGSIFLSFGAGKVFILIFSVVKTGFEVLIDYDSIIRKSLSDKLKSQEN